VSHTCHACGCDTPIPPKLLCCLKHWRRVPRALQSAVWAEYRPGQEVTKHPSAAYMTVQRAAMEAVCMAEGRTDCPVHGAEATRTH
jgi:hypothetical protein